jgi:hypothetical protein
VPAAQLNRLLRDLDTFGKVFDLTRDRLAVRAQEVVADAMMADMAIEEDPDGSPWPELSPAYAKWKAATVGGQPMAVLHHVMRTIENLRGQELNTIPTEATFVFGLDAQSQEEAEWFQDPTNPIQPPRPFYSLSIPAVAKLDQFFDSEFNRFVR